MKLYFVRHTTPADSAVSDAKRPLTPQGEEEARVVGAALASMNIQPTRILSSPLLRACQTAAIIGRELKFAGTTKPIDELTNGSPTASLLLAIHPVVADGEVILVGHMPSLAEHVAELTNGRGSSDFAFGKGSVACIELPQSNSSRGKLQWFKHLPQFR